MKKKILIVTDAWMPQINGVVRVFKEITKILEARGYEVVIAHPHLFGTMSLPFYPEIKIAPFAAGPLGKMIETENPDYIHVATEGPLGLSARNWCIDNKKPFTTSYHTQFPLYLSYYLKTSIGTVSAGYAYLRWFHQPATVAMVNTPSLKAELDSKDFSNVVLWPLGVDSDFFQRQDTKDLPQFEHPVFTYLGRVAEEKNIEEFLQADLPGTKLIIGDGPDRQRLEKKYGKTNHFVGVKKEEELVRWLSLSDVFVFPSRTETLGLVILEALSCGIPVAAHEVTGPMDVIESGVDGYLDEDIGKAALQCIDLAKEKCREKALAHSWEASVDVFLKNIAL